MASFAFLVGCIWGSFLNVCIERLPQGQSLLRPSSRCPRCHIPIRFYDNIPLISWLILRGRCRHCAQPISPRYPLVEALGGVLALLLLKREGLTALALAHYLLASALVVAAFIDLTHMLIPDQITIPGTALSLGTSALPGGLGWRTALLGMILGGGVLWGLRALYGVVRRREGLGLGDVKLGTMLGAMLGPQGVAFMLPAAALSGAMVGTVAALRRGRGLDYALPFGPFLAGAGIFYLVLLPWHPLGV